MTYVLLYLFIGFVYSCGHTIGDSNCKGHPNLADFFFAMLFWFVGVASAMSILIRGK